MSSSNYFTDIKNTFKDDILNSLPGIQDNIYLVQDYQGSIQVAIDAARAKGHSQQDPAIVLITPDSSTGTSTTDVQFSENLTLYDGIFVLSQVPYKRVNINGTVSLGSTALGTDYAGNANTNIWYLMQDLHFITATSGAPILNAATALVTRLDMTRVDFTKGGDAAGDACVSIAATSVYTVNMDRCVLTNNSSNAANYSLRAINAAHVVNIRDLSRLTVAGGALTVNSLVVDNGATVSAWDSTLVGLVNLGATAVSLLNLHRCFVTGNVAAATGLITFAANNASIATVSFTLFTPNTHVNIFTVGGATNIIRGYNCDWEYRVTALTAINSGAVTAVGVAGSSWSGGPIPRVAAAPANAIQQMLWSDTTDANSVKML